MQDSRIIRILKTTAKIIAGFVLLILVLLTGLYIYLNSDNGKKFLKTKAENYLSDKLKTTFTVGSIDFSLPNSFELNHVYLEDRQRDTLLYGEQLSVKIALFKLIDGETVLKKVGLKNVTAKIKRQATDSLFNFQFIVDAFAAKSKPSETPVTKDTTALKIMLHALNLDRVYFSLHDDYAGNYLAASIDHLDLGLNRFQPDKIRFGLNTLEAKGITFSMLTTKADSKNEADTTPAENQLLLTAKKIKLDRVAVNIQNKISGFLYSNQIASLELQEAKADLKKERIELDAFTLRNSAFQIETNPTNDGKQKDTSFTQPASWVVRLSSLQLDSNTFIFNQGKGKKIGGFDPQHLQLTNLTLHAENTWYSTDSIRSDIGQFAFTDHSGLRLDTLHANLLYAPHVVSADELYLRTPHSIIKDQLRLTFDSLSNLKTRPADAKLIVSLKESTIAFNDLFTLSPELKKTTPLNAFTNQYVKINALMTGSLQQLDIPWMQLSGLSGSYLQTKGSVFNITDQHKFAVDLKLHPVVLAKNDIVKVAKLSQQAIDALPAQVNIDAKVIGSVQDMQTDIQVSAGDLLLDAKTIVKNITDPQNLQYDALIRNGRVKKKLLLAFIPKEKLPASLEFPELITLTGKLKGDQKNILPDIAIGGSYGMVRVNGYVKNFTDATRSTYDLSLHSEGFAIGQLIKQDSTIGKVTMQAYLKGQGFDPQRMQTTADINIHSVGFKQYDYQNIVLKAIMNNGRLESDGSIEDPNLALHYSLDADFSAKYPATELWLHLDTARLHALHLIDDTLNLSLQTHLKADQLDPAAVDASLRIDSIRIDLANQRLFLDSFTIDAEASNGQQQLRLRSPMAWIDAQGRFQYNQLAPSVINFLNQYYTINKELAQATAPQQIEINGIFREHPLVKNFVKGLTRYDSITFRTIYHSDAADSALRFDLHIPYVAYTDKKLFNGKLLVNAVNDRLNFLAGVDTLYTGTNKLYANEVSGFALHDSISADAITKDAKGRTLYQAGVAAVTRGESYFLRLKKDLILDYKSWTVDPTNEIFYSAQGFYVNHFKLNYQQSGIDIQSEQSQPGSPVNIDIQRFQLSDITALFNRDTLLATGVVNAKARVSDFEQAMPAFEGNIHIDSIRYKQSAVGNLSATARKINNDKISAQASLSGNGNDVKLSGDYFPGQTDQQFEAQLGIHNFNIATLEGFTQGQLSASSGSINGDLRLNGKFTEPHWSGKLVMKDPRFRLTKFGTMYTIQNQQIGFEYPNIRFNQFSVSDTAGHTLVINGTVKALAAANFGLDLGIKSNDFILVNAPKASNDFIYGFAAVDAHVQVSGTIGAPDIQGTLSLSNETDATIILPEKNIDKEVAKSVVRFIDRDTFPLPERVLFVPENPEETAISTFLNYNLNVQLSPKSALTIVIDPGTGDEIKLQGDAKLNVGVDPGGNIILAGNYNLDQGHYILHYQFLERKFNLLNGSTVAFGGGPLEAQMDIKAEYIANTSAIDLVGNELGDADTKTAMTFNQKIPFRVLLFIKGTLKDLKISFDIQLPDENKGLSNTIVTTVENKLSQLRSDPAAINKQVFSLLVLNRFVGEQSMDFFKGNGDGVSDIARQSVSKFLSAALDQIAADLIRGVDIDLNVNSYKDYSSGAEQQRTDVNIGVSKRFMDDRLTISVGKNLGVEGQDRSAKARQQSTGSYIPDATINYKLSKDGRYMLRAYSKNKFEVIMDGYVVETGLSFVVSMDYEKFNELFYRKRKKKNG